MIQEYDKNENKKNLIYIPNNSDKLLTYLRKRLKIVIMTRKIEQSGINNC